MRPQTTIPTRLCARCGVPLPTDRHARSIYCSPRCSREPYLNPSPLRHINASTVGTIQELRVSSDLLLRGYAVFRALSPACTCDLAILAEGKLLRIEVTTGVTNPRTGAFRWSPHDPERYDVLAVVTWEGEITYLPALAEVLPGA